MSPKIVANVPISEHHVTFGHILSVTTFHDVVGDTLHPLVAANMLSNMPPSPILGRR